MAITDLTGLTGTDWLHMLSEDLIASGANVECYYDAVGIGGQLVTVKLRSSDGCRVLARWYAHGLEVVQEVKMKPGGWR